MTTDAPHTGAWALAYRVAGGVLGAAASAVATLTRRRGLSERLGFGAELPDRLRPLWFHGASVGELATIRPLAAEVRARWPEAVYGHTATTRTGRAAARSQLPEAVFTRLLPLDGWPALGRFLDATHPGAVIVVETELWPGLLSALARRNVPVALASARMSARSHARYLRVRSLFRELLSGLVLVGARSEDDRARFLSLGAHPDRTVVLGNTKLDADDAEGAWSEGQESRLQTLVGDRHLLVWGCLRPDEERHAFAAMERGGGDRLWVFAPRHLPDFDRLAGTLRARGVSFARWSRLREGSAPASPPDVLLLDTLGELRHLYARADVAIVGGTFAHYGGHNLMEPARLGVPVVFGPDTSNWPDDATRLEDAGGGLRVADAAALSEALDRLLGEPAERSRVGCAARTAAESGRGASGRIVDALSGRGFFDGVTGVRGSARP